jgi:hypothetical protein
MKLHALSCCDTPTSIRLEWWKMMYYRLLVEFKWKTQSLCLIKDYRNAELTRSPCVYVDGPWNNMDMTDRTRCLHESITDCNYWNVHSVSFGLNYHHQIEIQSNTNVDIRFHGIWPLRFKIWTTIMKIFRKSIFFEISYMEIIPCVLTLAKITLKNKSKRAWTIFVLCRFNFMPKIYGF